MTTLNQLSTATTLTSSDQMIFYSTVNGSGRKASLATLLDWIEANFASPDFTKQYASPNVNGTNVAVSSTTSSTWLILTPTAAFAAMTITLPAAASVADGTEVLVSCSQAVTTLTIAGNGAIAVLGAPTTLQAGVSFMLRYNSASSTWYTVQSSTNTSLLTQGTFVPVPTLAVPPTGTTFGGRYTVVGNVVTLEFSITITNPGTFAFTTATDFFTGLPPAIQPTSQQQFLIFNPVADGWQLAMFYNAGLWKMFFVKSGSPTFSISVPPDPAGTYRWTVTYLV